MSSSHLFDQLIQIMARLRDAENGCPWDLQQDFKTIVPYTLEEAYEVADAIERSDYSALCDELGDLLFQVIFHARMAEEAEYFTIQDVCRAINDKLSRRHPHIFGDEKITSAEGVSRRWAEIKASERATKRHDSQLDGLARALPALKYAQKMQGRAAHVGFDWPDIDGVRDKNQEELTELEAAQQAGLPKAIEEELGDLLFSCVNLSRHLGIDAENALRLANHKFEARFRYMELQAGEDLSALSSEELEHLWALSKQADLH